MTKEELVCLTIKQLKEGFKKHPECLQLEDPELGKTNYGNSTIIWRFKVEIDGTLYNDPNNNSRTVIISYSKLERKINASIYLRDVGTASQSIMPDASASISYHEHLPLFLYKSYRDFMYLRKQLIDRQKEKENIDFVKKLTSVFPGTFEDDILG